MLHQDLTASIDEGVKLVTVDQNPPCCAANAEARSAISLNWETHDVQCAALQEAVHGVNADTQVRGCRFAIQQSASDFSQSRRGGAALRSLMAVDG